VEIHGDVVHGHLLHDGADAAPILPIISLVSSIRATAAPQSVERRLPRDHCEGDDSPHRITDLFDDPAQLLVVSNHRPFSILREPVSAM
jgi:hypothetical protein